MLLSCPTNSQQRRKTCSSSCWKTSSSTKISFEMRPCSQSTRGRTSIMWIPPQVVAWRNLTRLPRQARMLKTMGTITAGLASSHAFTLLDPATWDERRAWNRGAYARRYGVEPPMQQQVAEENLDNIRPRYERIRGGLEHLRDELTAMRPQALIVIGDDQD